MTLPSSPLEAGRPLPTSRHVECLSNDPSKAAPLRKGRMDQSSPTHTQPLVVDCRIIAPVDHCSQTVGGKIVDGQVVHGQSFRSKHPEYTDDRSEGAVYTMGSMAYCPSIPLCGGSRHR